MTRHPSVPADENSSETENKNLTFQPLLKISRTEQLVITHQEILKISHTEKTVLLSGDSEEKTASFQAEKFTHLANARKNLDRTFEKHHQMPPKKTENEIGIHSGLDCSGQGMCQPNIEPSDNDIQQSVLVKANQNARKQKIKQRLNKNESNKI